MCLRFDGVFDSKKYSSFKVLTNKNEFIIMQKAFESRLETDEIKNKLGFKDPCKFKKQFVQNKKNSSFNLKKRLFFK